MLVTDADYRYLRSLYPLVRVRSLSSQEENCLLYHLRGMSEAEAARAAGYEDEQATARLLRREDARLILGYLRDKTLGDARIDVERLTGMLLEAHRKSATATEEIAAVRELGKLHGLYPEQKKSPSVQINQQINVTNTTQLKRLSDAELLRLAGDNAALTELLAPPTPVTIDHDV